MIDTLAKANDRFSKDGLYEAKEFIIKFFDTKGNAIGYLKDDKKETYFDEDGCFTDANVWPITQNKSEALKFHWNEDFLVMKDEQIEGCELFHIFDFGSYLVEIISK